jgi:hypothetical protein
MRLSAAFLICCSACFGQWVMSTATSAAVRAIAPDVHSVYSDSRFVYVESAGLSLRSFGGLQANQYEAPAGPRKLTFRLPRDPRPAAKKVSTPLGVTGVFVTGVPIYNPIGTDSYNDQNIWHRDAVASAAAGPAIPALPSPIVGFALDGYPIVAVAGVRSSYRLRQITKRTVLPDGTLLTPGQEGPAVGPEFPLGTFAEDYEYVAGSGDLDEFNGRPTEGSYAYYVTQGWPYLIGGRYYGEPSLDAPGRVSVQRSGEVELWTDRLQIEANQPVWLSLDFHTRFLEKIHEKPVHLIVVSQDLGDFSHIHPSASAGDVYSVSHTFSAPGEYWVYADYTAPGGQPSVRRFSLSVGGRAEARLQGGSPAPHVRFEAPLQIEANRDVALAFHMDTADLEPWLGAWAHIMIISRDGAEFIHAHPLENASVVHSHTAPMVGPSPLTIRTQTGFKSPGEYKVWFQFQRGGEVFTVPFDLTVKASAPVLQNEPKTTPGAIRVTVSRAGFEPARIEVLQNEPIHLAFTRLDAQNCGSEVVFPSLGLRKSLPVGQTVLIDLPARGAGQLSFACGMGMYKGAVVVK